jgi:hypothetical protein
MADDELTLNNNNRFQLVQPFESKTVAEATSGQSLEIKPVQSSSSTTVELKPVAANQTLELKPLQTSADTTVELRPVTLDSRQEANSTLDVKPLAVDLVVRSGQTALPANHVCQPYQHRIGLSLLGVEWLGLSWSGETQTIVDDRPGSPVTVWGPVTAAASPGSGPCGHQHHHDPPRAGHEPTPRPDRPKGGKDDGGLRIRLR